MDLSLVVHALHAIVSFLAIPILIVGLVALALVIVTGQSPAQYARGEWRLMRMKTWAQAEQDVARLGSIKHPHVRRMVIKQRVLGNRLRREGRALLADKPYTPALTKPAPAVEETPPKADKVVVPIRGRRASR